MGRSTRGEGWLAHRARRVRRRALTGAEVFRREGPSRLLARASAILGGVVYRHVLLFARDLSRPLPEVSTDLPIEIRLLRHADLDAYARFRGDAAHLAAAQQRLERGDFCIAAWLEDEIASAAWVSFGESRLAEIGRRLSLTAGEVYTYDSYTTERLRGRGVAAARAVWSAAHLRDAGYRRSIGSVSPRNRPALGPPEKAGYRMIGIAGFVRLGPLRRDFVQRAGGQRRWVRRDKPIVAEHDFALPAAIEVLQATHPAAGLG
jgi:hypothetical protein